MSEFLARVFTDGLLDRMPVCKTIQIGDTDYLDLVDCSDFQADVPFIKGTDAFGREFVSFQVRTAWSNNDDDRRRRGYG